MKKQILMALAVACTLTACEQPVTFTDEELEAAAEAAKGEPTKKFTFTLKGDFSDEWKPVTRGYLEADGKAMTDVFVLDYMDGTLAQQRHLTQTDEDWAAPVLNLAYGDHHVYFIASRGTSPTLSTTDGTITWQSVRDTFWKDYEVSVVATSNGNRAVTLDRVVTKLNLAFTDAISADAATINFTPETWYYGLNYKTGEPTAATTAQTNTMNVPDGYAGRTDVSVSYFCISPSTEWTTDVTINSKDADGNIIGQATMTAVPLKRNRATEYSGPLFGSEGTMALTLSTDWDAAFEGTW